MRKDNGGPAFPREDYQANGSAGFGGLGQEGLSMREYYAAKAMSGLISGSMAYGSPFGIGDEKQIAKYAFIIADAMLSEGGK